MIYIYLIYNDFMFLSNEFLRVFTPFGDKAYPRTALPGKVAK